MVEKLRRTYFTLLIPAIVGFIGISAAKKFNLVEFGHLIFQEIIAPLVFVLSVVFAIAWPIFFRTLFAHKNRHQKSIPEVDLIKFERNFLYIVLVTPYLMLTAYLFEFPRFYLAGTVLMTLYAVYYYYPSKKRIQFERRIFRVK
jgi:Ca2+/Na+ antiporter